jgi:hypothetical protein
MAVCSLDAWQAIVKKAVEQAKAGNDRARSWLSKVLQIDAAEILQAGSSSGPAENTSPGDPCEVERIAWLQRVAGQIQALATPVGAS